MPIKFLVYKYSEPNMPKKLAIDMKPSVSKLCVLFCTCFLLKPTAHVYTKELNVHPQSQNGFCGIFVGIPQC